MRVIPDGVMGSNPFDFLPPDEWVVLACDLQSKLDKSALLISYIDRRRIRLGMPCPVCASPTAHHYTSCTLDNIVTDYNLRKEEAGTSHGESDDESIPTGTTAE